MSKLDELKGFINGLEHDFVKFYEKGQGTAGTRLRKSLSELRKMAQDIRNDIQTVKLQRKEAKKQ
ncbi:MAG: histone H1 [Ignavibacteriales bacterium]|jgi:hypothetical protein|nr:histone H1 [Ignavibacteriaceae bacterium]NLH61477.1 histone H1 [Ignavibacteriales bacterium]HOJ17495.1 histone H1 [Ignavibacteriaceae bacterium]HPO54782.1 histone H1 [Ignavibacteriaceae bacterium]